MRGGSKKTGAWGGERSRKGFSPQLHRAGGHAWWHAEASSLVPSSKVLRLPWLWFGLSSVEVVLQVDDGDRYRVLCLWHLLRISG